MFSVYSGFRLGRFLVYAGFSLGMFSVYSGFSLGRFSGLLRVRFRQVLLYLEFLFLKGNSFSLCDI